jgi:hypothetical protein
LADGLNTQVCAYLYERNNFNSLKMVLCGLQCQAVHRLRKTWAAVKESQVRKFKSLQVCTLHVAF